MNSQCLLSPARPQSAKFTDLGVRGRVRWGRGGRIPTPLGTRHTEAPRISNAGPPSHPLWSASRVSASGAKSARPWREVSLPLGLPSPATRTLTVQHPGPGPRPRPPPGLWPLEFPRSDPAPPGPGLGAPAAGPRPHRPIVAGRGGPSRELGPAPALTYRAAAPGRARPGRARGRTVRGARLGGGGGRTRAAEAGGGR